MEKLLIQFSSFVCSFQPFYAIFSVGKKWLKISLLGESEAHESETPLEVISCRRWCSIDKDGRWKTKTKQDKQQQQQQQQHQPRNFDGQGTLDLFNLITFIIVISNALPRQAVLLLNMHSC